MFFGSFYLSFLLFIVLPVVLFVYLCVSVAFLRKRIKTLENMLFDMKFNKISSENDKK